MKIIPKRRWPARVLCFCAALYLLSVSAPVRASDEAHPVVLKLSIRGTIQPVSAGYLQRGLQHAAMIKTAAVLVEITTPGGLLESTRDMVADIEHSSVPVIFFVSPSGSRAASAGFFLLEAADVAAMAPGTNTGAAHPVLMGQKVDPVMKDKMENDAAAFMRSYVSRRGHNAVAAEEAIRQSKSYSDDEARKLNLVDIIASDDLALMTALDGRNVQRFTGSSAVLHTRGAQIVPFPQSTREAIFSRLVDPNLAVLLLAAGVLLIYLEFNVPGTIIPGTAGLLLVMLALFALNLLPLHYAAVMLLVAAVILVVLEAKFASHGVLAFIGVLCCVFGLLTLVDDPLPELRVHLGTALAVGVAFGGITAFLATIAVRARRLKVQTGGDIVLGQMAVAQTDLQPQGQVLVRGELWQALSTAPVRSGGLVRIHSREGLLLTVTPIDAVDADGTTRPMPV